MRYSTSAKTGEQAEPPPTVRDITCGPALLSRASKSGVSDDNSPYLNSLTLHSAFVILPYHPFADTSILFRTLSWSNTRRLATVLPRLVSARLLARQRDVVLGRLGRLLRVDDALLDIGGKRVESFVHIDVALG